MNLKADSLYDLKNKTLNAIRYDLDDESKLF
jgi:hypothetical protein